MCIGYIIWLRMRRKHTSMVPWGPWLAIVFEFCLVLYWLVCPYIDFGVPNSERSRVPLVWLCIQERESIFLKNCSEANKLTFIFFFSDRHQMDRWIADLGGWLGHMALGMFKKMKNKEYILYFRFDLLRYSI